MADEKLSKTAPQPGPSKNNHESKCSASEPNVGIYTALLTVHCLIGLGLSLYAYTVELRLEHDRNYKPYCDVSPNFSCTKAFGSEYGKGMGIFGKDWKTMHQPNSLFGIMFYSMLGTLAQSSSKFSVNLCLVLTILSNFASLYFSYILYFILHDLCVVCILIYVVNVTNLIILQKKWKKLKIAWSHDNEIEQKEKSKIKKTK